MVIIKIKIFLEQINMFNNIKDIFIKIIISKNFDYYKDYSVFLYLTNFKFIKFINIQNKFFYLNYKLLLK